MGIKQIFRENWLNLANLFTITRLAFILPYLYIGSLYAQSPQLNYLIFLWVLLLLASLTDTLDGIIARRLQQKTKLGIYLDPFCDKIVILFNFSLLVFYFAFPLWIYIAYIIREALWVYMGIFLYLKRNLQVLPNYLGKLSVVLIIPLTIWYTSIPWLSSILSPGHWLLDASPSMYLWGGVFLAATVTAMLTYWKVVFPMPNRKSQQIKSE